MKEMQGDANCKGKLHTASAVSPHGQNNEKGKRPDTLQSSLASN
jgi:hypothetical protein